MFTRHQLELKHTLATWPHHVFVSKNFKVVGAE